MNHIENFLTNDTKDLKLENSYFKRFQMSFMQYFMKTKK